MGFPWWLGGKQPTCNTGDTEDEGSVPRSGRSPGEGNGNPFQYLAGKIPWTEEPGGLQSMGLRRVRHDSAHMPGTGQQKEKVIIGVELSASSPAYW